MGYAFQAYLAGLVGFDALIAYRADILHRADVSSAADREPLTCPIPLSLRPVRRGPRQNRVPCGRIGRKSPMKRGLART